MNCFQGYIGVGLHCQTDESLSGKYLTDLPGVSLQNIDAAANEEQGSFIGVFADVEKRAMSRITKDILVHLKSQYNLKKSVATYSTGGDIGGSVPALSKKHGVNVYTYFDDSELIRLHVGKVSLYALEAKETTLYIYSGINLLWSKTFTTVVGWNEVLVNKSFDATDIIIAYDDTLFDNIPTLVFEEDTCGCAIEICNNCDIFKRGVSFENIGIFNYGYDTKGLKAEVSIRCAYESIICANIDIYADAYLYALGVELMRERLYSDRVNRFTTIDRKKAQELIELFTQDYTDFLQTANNTVSLKDDACVECLESSGYKYMLP